MVLVEYDNEKSFTTKVEEWWFACQGVLRMYKSKGLSEVRIKNDLIEKLAERIVNKVEGKGKEEENSHDGRVCWKNW
ncbi:48_t:CDS:2 [Gigaspora margarita]|uniref:48_t:CDS:1 n=1 Tax=Gigaspora margarita TaxID=4874 RepID=A0ABN7WAD4_GIGMA|nr:48_t:CDS:2 [Gigaspora margarita]